MKKMLLLLAFIVASPPAAGAATCAAVASSIYGFTLGPVQNYPDGLRDGIVREGTAEVIAGVGFETLEGKSDGVVYPRIMLFFDRGRFIGFMAVGRIVSEEDQGFQRIVKTVSATANATPALDDGRAVFECERNLELRVEPTEWGGMPHVRVHLMDTVAHKRMMDNIEKYCTDPKRRRPQDACKQ